jgi:predicted transcriptional regulator
MYDIMAQRLNTRVDDELAAKVDQLRKLTGKNSSAVIKAALEAYYEQVSSTVAARGAKVALQRAGFLACAQGDPNLSRDSKRVLGESLRRKA